MLSGWRPKTAGLNAVSRSQSDSLPATGQLSLPFSSSDQVVQPQIKQEPKQQTTQQQRRKTTTKVIRLGNPAIPVKITEFGTYIAKLDHIWRAARTYAKHNNYKLLEMYGVIGVAPFSQDKVETWLGYLNIPYRLPVEVYQLYDRDLTWIAEWNSG